MKTTDITKALLLESAIIDARKLVQYANASARPAAEEELAVLEARWAAEAPIRAARAKLSKAGFRKSDFGPEWIRKNGLGRWEKFSIAAACAAAGLEVES